MIFKIIEYRENDRESSEYTSNFFIPRVLKEKKEDFK
tara:strand:- start:501 stop:611 length:111 start_codon:yes stop_codon:yes gene_type:complete